MIYSRLKIALLCVPLALLGIVSFNHLARAHAEYERSEPAADAVIPAAPPEVHIWFTEELFRRQDVNAIEVSGPDGNRVDQNDIQLEDDDRKHAFVSLQPNLPPGLYTVSWRNLSIEDGHEGSGEFSFTVEAGAEEAPLQANPTAAQQPTAKTPTSIPASTATLPPTPASPPMPTPPPSSGGLPCLGGLLLGGVFLTVLTIGQHRRGQS